MKLSVVATMYYSASYIDEFYRRVCAAADPVTDDFEIVLVNDGSPDNSLEVALALRQRDSRVRVVDLSRNFGHHKAMMIGCAHARGELVFLLDIDLEEPPEALPMFYEKLTNSSADVVYGAQPSRAGALGDRLFGEVFYTLFNFFSFYPIPRSPLTLRLMTRRYVEALLRHRENLFNIEALWAITGYEQIEVKVDKTERPGQSTYTLGKKLAYVTNAITAFSTKPLIYIAVLGMIITVPAGLYILYILFQYFFLGVSVEGWTTLIVSLWFLMGLMFIILGVIAIYLSVIFVEIKARPYAIVRQVYENPNGELPLSAAAETEAAESADPQQFYR
jgi:putative glycosyltransferase